MYFHNQNVLNFTMRADWQTLFIGYGSSAISGSYFPTSYVFCAGTSSTYANITAGNIYATNFYTTSDGSKKQNISSFSEHIRKFTLKESNKDMYGVIAQEVPEMFRDGKEGDYTVNYNSVLSYYVGCLENKVAELEEKIKELWLPMKD
jgi:hypothetical protein